MLLDLEKSLRIGQANDALHQVRLNIGYKALVFRVDVRQSTHSQQKKTRAWAAVSSVERVIRVQARLYRRCYRTMKDLPDTAEFFRDYHELKKEDLTARTSVLAPGGRHLRDSQLAWFWMLGVERQTDPNDWMTNCKSVFLVLQMLLNFSV